MWSLMFHVVASVSLLNAIFGIDMVLKREYKLFDFS